MHYILYFPVSSLEHLKIKIYNTTLLPAVLYVYETWSSSSVCMKNREEGIWEQSAEERIFGSHSNEVTEDQIIFT